MTINSTDYQKLAAAEYTAGATHILVWTVPGDVLDAYWKEKEGK